MTNERQLVDFMGLLAELGNGATIAQLAEELTNVVDAVKVSGKKGKLVIEVVVGPKNFNKLGDMTSVEVDVIPKAVLPKPAPPSGIFFLYEDGRVSQRHPDHEQQHVMDFGDTERQAN